MPYYNTLILTVILGLLSGLLQAPEPERPGFVGKFAGFQTGPTAEMPVDGVWTVVVPNDQSAVSQVWSVSTGSWHWRFFAEPRKRTIMVQTIAYA